MVGKNIVVGQRVEPEKVQRAKELRRNMTESEETLWQCLRGNMLSGFHFRRQQVIQGFIVDFYCHRAGLVVEVDGAVHNEQVEYDEDRDRVLSGLGLKVVRITNDEIEQDLANVLNKIETACRNS